MYLAGQKVEPKAFSSGFNNFEKYDGTYPIEDREAAITGHIGLIHHIVARYHRKGGDPDELLSRALVKLIETVDFIIENGLKEPYNVTGFIVSRIHSELSKYEPPMQQLKDDYSYEDNSVEFRDSLEHAMQTRLERAIIRMRIGGMKDNEIGEACGLSHVEVFRIRKRVGRRILNV